MKGDQYKRPTKETNTRNLPPRKINLQKRPTKETYFQEKRPI